MVIFNDFTVLQKYVDTIRRGLLLLLLIKNYIINYYNYKTKMIKIKRCYLLLTVSRCYIALFVYVCNNVNPKVGKDRFWKVGFISGIIKLNTITVNDKSTTNFT